MNVQNTLRQYGEWDIRLKDDNNKKKLDFAPVRRKIFSRIVLLMAGAFFGIWFLYQYVLQGRFADGIVRFLYDFTSMTYEDARDFYWHNIGNHFRTDFLWGNCTGILSDVLFLFKFIYKIFSGN